MEENYLFFFLSCFNFENNACLHKSTHLPHVVLIFLYESHILLQICADKIAGHSSFFFFHLGLINWTSPLPNVYIFFEKNIYKMVQSVLEIPRKTVFLHLPDKNALFSGSSYMYMCIFIYVYIYVSMFLIIGGETQKHHPWNFWLAYHILIVYRNLKN